MHYFVFILLQEFDYKYPRGTTPHILPPSYFSFLIASLLCIRQNTLRAAENNEWDRSDFRIKLTIISWVWGCLPIGAFISWEYANHACSCMWVHFVYASVLVCVRLYLRLFHVLLMILTMYASCWHRSLLMKCQHLALFQTLRGT